MSRGSPAWFLAIFALALSPAARADGLFVWRNEQIDIHEPEQKALIVFDEGVEDLVLSVKFEGAPEEFGWIVPLPSVSEMFPEDILLFEELSKATQARQFWRSDRGFRIHQTMGMSDVSVIATETVGVYEATVVASESGEALRHWLKERGFRLPKGSEDVFGRYASQGWVFTALRIQPTARDSAQAHQLASGTIQPIRFRFRCKEPVFPLEISSLGRHESTVLLYVLSREGLVPRNGPRQGWETQIHTRAWHGWITVYEYNHPEAPFLPHAQTPFVLTKHRGTFRPRDMHDVSFVGYDPGKALQSKDEATRTEAATHIGLLKLSEYLPQLLTNLDGPNTYTSLWALGELGGSEAERVLLGQTEHWDPETRLEAIEALATMRSRRALPVFVRGLQRRPTSNPSDQRGAAVQRASFDHLVEYGDASCIPALREIAAADSGVVRWERVGANDGNQGRATVGCDPPGLFSDGIAPGVLAVAALAACGDVASTSVLVEGIVRGGRCTEEASLRSKASARVMHGDYPGGFWTGEVTQHGLTSLMDWCALRWVDNLFGADSTPRDGIFRRAAADPRLPDAGRVVLLGNVVNPSHDDTGELMRIWKRAIKAPVMLDVTSYAFRRGDQRASTIRFNANACCVAYALGRHKRVNELLRTLEQAPRGDAELRGEIISALAATGDPKARAVAWSYVRDTFGAASRTPQFEAKVQSELEASRSPHELLQLPPGAFDRAWRERSIWRALFGPTNVEFLREAITDRALAPYLHLRVLAGSDGFGYFGEGEALLPIARAELDDLCRTQTSPTFQAYAKALRESLERTAQTLAIPRAQRYRDATGK